MICVRCLGPVVLLCALAACDAAPLQQQTDDAAGQNGVSVSATSGGQADAASGAASVSAKASASSAVHATLTPHDAPDDAALDQTGDPARVAAFLAAALQDGRWADAARAWGESGNAESLERRFGAGAPIRLMLERGETEGAAGSLYYSAPYRLRRVDSSLETGTLVLRRVNDVPGASAASLRWHVETMERAP